MSRGSAIIAFPMYYREIVPSPALRAHVRCYWFLRARTGQADAEPVLPDGSVEWVFHLGAPFFAAENGVMRRQAESLCVHDLERPITLMPGGEVDVVGIRFRPGRAYPFLTHRSAVLHGRTWDLCELGSVNRSIRERLASFRSDDARADWLDRFLFETLERSGVDRSFDDLVNAMDCADGAIPIDQLAALRGVSRRQLERIFLDHVGMGPKRFSRLLRFRSVVREIRSNARSWLDRAMAAGYFDQSHLIREFRTFAGMPPGELARRLLPMNDLFVSSADSMSHSSNPGSVHSAIVGAEEGR